MVVLSSTSRTSRPKSWQANPSELSDASPQESSSEAGGECWVTACPPSVNADPDMSVWPLVANGGHSGGGVIAGLPMVGPVDGGGPLKRGPPGWSRLGILMP